MKHSILCLVALAALAATRSYGGSTAWSAPTSIDFREDNARRVAPVAIPYSPDFVAGGNAADGKVELLRISHYDTFRPSTQSLVSVSSPAVGAATLPAPDAGAYRLVLRAFDANDALVGEISAAVGLGVASPFAAETLADMADEKLDRLIQTGATPRLAYSSAWADGAASVAIDALMENGSAKTLFSANAPADGLYDFTPVGDKRTRNAVRFHFYDSGDNEIGEPLVAYYTGIADSALVIIMR